MAHKDWIKAPIGGGTTCPAPMTRAALIVLRNSGGLSKDCDYVVTDHVQGRLVAGTQIHLQAVDANTLSMHAQVKTTYDNIAWEGRYDIDAALVTELRDNRNNVVIGSAPVSAFDWGNAAYAECRVEHATWTVTIGSVRPMTRVRVLDASTLTTVGMTGGGLNNVEVSKQSTANFTDANISVSHSTVTESATLTVSGYVAAGTGIQRLRLQSSTLTLGAGSGVAAITSSSIENGATVTHTGTGTFTLNQSRVSEGAAIAHASTGAIYMLGCTVEGAASAIQHTAAPGSISMTGTKIGPYGRVIKTDPAATGTLTLNYGVIDTVSYVQQSGQGNIGSTGLRASGLSYVRTLAGSNVPTLTVNYSTLQDSSFISMNATATAGNASINYVSLTSNGYVDKSGTGVLTVTSSTCSGGGRVSLSGARSLTVQGAALTNLGRALSTATAGAGVTDSLQYTSVSDYGVVTFGASGAAANNVLYSSVRGNTGSITFSGTNRGTNVTRMTVDNGNATFSSNTVAFPTILDIGLRDQGTLNVSGCTAAQDIRYSTVQSYSRWNMTNRSAVAQSFGIDLSANATLTQINAAGNALYVSAKIGTINHNGGALNSVIKEMGGVLTTGAFNHSNIQHRVNASKTLTTNNTSRADYQGLAAQLV